MVSVISSHALPGTFEVYVENTTGWEPLPAAAAADDAADPEAASLRPQGHHDCALLRYTTTDFDRYSAGHVALRVPSCSGTPTMKSIARSPEGAPSHTALHRAWRRARCHRPLCCLHSPCTWWAVRVMGAVGPAPPRLI